MRTIQEIREFDEWYKKNNPTPDQMNDYWKEKDKNKPQQEEKNFNFSYGLDDNYQGLGNGNYTMEEYASYEFDY